MIKRKQGKDDHGKKGKVPQLISFVFTPVQPKRIVQDLLSS